MSHGYRNHWGLTLFFLIYALKKIESCNFYLPLKTSKTFEVLVGFFFFYFKYLLIFSFLPNPRDTYASIAKYTWKINLFTVKATDTQYC